MRGGSGPGVGAGPWARDLVRTMSPQPAVPRFYFDFVDPVSYLTARELEAAVSASGIVVEWIGVEIVPPSHPLTTPDDPVWSERWRWVRALSTEGDSALDLSLETPPLVPWTRKAHELVLHAEAADGRGAEVRGAVFEAFFTEGLDIGRVDVLVGLARRHGLDLTETKAVLDVDRYGEEVAARRAEALGAGLRTVPTLAAGGRTLEGFHNRASLSTFLHGSS